MKKIIKNLFTVKYLADKKINGLKNRIKSRIKPAKSSKHPKLRKKVVTGVAAVAVVWAASLGAAAVTNSSQTAAAPTVVEATTVATTTEVSAPVEKTSAYVEETTSTGLTPEEVTEGTTSAPQKNAVVNASYDGRKTQAVKKSAEITTTATAAKKSTTKASTTKKVEKPQYSPQWEEKSGYAVVDENNNFIAFYESDAEACENCQGGETIVFVTVKYDSNKKTLEQAVTEQLALL